MASRTRKLTVEIGGDASGATKAFGKVEQGGSRLSKNIGGVAKVIAGAFVVDRIFEFGGALISAAEDAERVGKQTDAVIKSTGKAAKVTAKQVGDYAEELSLLSGVDDEVIQSGQNLLLTFTKIRNETGKGNDVFDQATEAALNMSVAMGKDLNSSVTMVGKALNDPIKGMTALSKAGVQFSEDQKAAIKALVESGDVLGAQKIILAELTTQFGGSAEAQATASDKLKVAWDNVYETLGTLLLPTFQKVSTWLAETLPPAAEKATEAGRKVGEWARDNEPLVRALAVTVGVVLAGAMLVYTASALSAAAATIAATWPIILAVAAAVALAAAFIYAYNTNENFRRSVDKAIPYLKIFGAYLWSTVAGAVQLAAAIGSVIAKIDTLVRKIPGGRGGLGGWVMTGLKGAVPGLGLLDGARASGGPVTSGGAYLVGEQGPELFVPRSSGSVIPNGAMGGNRYTINVSVPPTADKAGIGAELVGAIAAYEGRSGTAWRR